MDPTAPPGGTYSAHYYAPTFLINYPLINPINAPPGDDSWDLITCFCRKPFAGRPMIECSHCGTWIHLSCARIRRSNVPDVFKCHRCRGGGARKGAPPHGT